MTRPTGDPIVDLKPPAGLTTDEQRQRLDALAKLNELDLQKFPGNSELAARISSYELAYRMQGCAPSAVDVLATCTANNALYTIAANETWEQLQTVVWDTGKYQSTGTIPLLTETYTLIIHDAAKDVSATAAAGYLGTWKQFTFGMYEPQPYTPMADYVCATCSGAMSLMEKQTYAFLFSMAGVTVCTFGWFTGAAGLW